MPIQPTTNNLEGWEEKKIKKIVDDVHMKWLSKAISMKTDDDEMTVLPYGYLSTAVKEVLEQFISDIRKHDMVELIKMIGEISPSYDGDALDTNNNRRWYDQGFGEHKKEVNQSLINLRK